MTHWWNNFGTALTAPWLKSLMVTLEEKTQHHSFRKRDLQTEFLQLDLYSWGNSNFTAALQVCHLTGRCLTFTKERIYCSQPLYPTSTQEQRCPASGFLLAGSSSHHLGCPPWDRAGDLKPESRSTGDTKWRRSRTFPIAARLTQLLACAPSLLAPDRATATAFIAGSGRTSSDEARTPVTTFSLPVLLHKDRSRFILLRDSNPVFFVATRTILSTEAVRWQIFRWGITRNMMWKNPTALGLTQYSSPSKL